MSKTTRRAMIVIETVLHAALRLYMCSPLPSSAPPRPAPAELTLKAVNTHLLSGCANDMQTGNTPICFTMLLTITSL